jgi:guanylate kinase
MTTAGARPQRGRLIVLAAPSGAGKTTLVHALLQRMPGLRFSISYTTRQPRKSEVDGRDYFFVDEDKFAAMVRGDEFLEHAQVFDHWYGTGRRHVESLLDSGETVLLEIDWQGARQVKRAAAEATSIFILPPSVTELEQRLRGRGTDSAATIERRLRDALGDMQHWQEFDYAIVNERLDEAAAALADVVAGHGEANRTDSPALRARIEAILQS